MDLRQRGILLGAYIAVCLLDFLAQFLVVFDGGGGAVSVYLVLGLNGANQRQTVKRVDFAFGDDMVISLLGELILSVVVANVGQIGDLLVLVVVAAVEADALDQRGLVVFLLDGKPYQKRGEFVVVGLLLGLFE